MAPLSLGSFTPDSRVILDHVMSMRSLTPDLSPGELVARLCPRGEPAGEDAAPEQARERRIGMPESHQTLD